MCDFTLDILWSKPLLASNPKRLEELKKMNEDCQHLRYESQIIIDPKYVKIFSPVALIIK